MAAIELLQGACDIHLHASPDVGPRAMDLSQLSAAEIRQMAHTTLKGSFWANNK